MFPVIGKGAKRPLAPGFGSQGGLPPSQQALLDAEAAKRKQDLRAIAVSKGVEAVVRCELALASVRSDIREEVRAGVAFVHDSAPHRHLQRPNTMIIERAINAFQSEVAPVALKPKRSQYTEHELLSAMLDVTRSVLTMERSTRAYGVPEKSLRDKLAPAWEKLALKYPQLGSEAGGSGKFGRFEGHGRSSQKTTKSWWRH